MADAESIVASQAIVTASAKHCCRSLYYCDYGGAGREFLGVVVAAMVSRFGPVTVSELE